MTRRTVALLGLACACLSLAPGAGAQGPLANSPAFPSPYQSPLFHSGGAVDPSTIGVPPFLYGQLQGTPTGTVIIGGLPIQTQIPSFLLGAYDPANPPTSALAYYREHFADGDAPTQWAAPFVYSPPSDGKVTVDDSDPAFMPPGPTVTSGFTQAGGWQQINSALSPAAGTATNGEYLRVSSKTSGAVATWQMLEPIAGNYSVYLNIPNDLPDINNVTELRSNQVTYFVTVRDSTGVVTATENPIASQTEANSNQFLAGPFQVPAGGTVTVVLECDQNRRVNYNGNTSNAAYYIVADSMLLTKARGDVQSTPTAINYESYPADFDRMQYWGRYIQPTSAVVSPLLTPTPAQGIIPDTKDGLNWVPTSTSLPILFYGKKGKPVNEFGASDPRRRIRQVVYFGRLEPVFNRSVTIDDNDTGGNFGGGGTTVISPSATQGEYKRTGAVMGLGVGNVISTWFLVAPSPIGATPTDFFVSVHLPATPVGETRVGRAAYTVTVIGVPGNPTKTYGPVRISQVTGTSDNTVTLPTGPILLDPGQTIAVSLYDTTGDTAPITANTYVVSDSVTLSTPPTRGAIYCVDGFTGDVIWRYETAASVNGPSAPAYSSPAVAKINVLVAPADPVNNTPAVYANKLVVIVGDNNGLLYCLDAVGNGDGTSNEAVLDADGQPIYIQQPPYVPLNAATGLPDTIDPTSGAAIPPLLKPGDAGYAPHVGTTNAYWIYRPDAKQPKQVVGGGANIGKVRGVDITRDVPVPAAFNTASPTIFVDPNKTGTPDTVTEIVPPVTNTGGLLVPPANAIVYIGNTNGVLYALDATGTAIDNQAQSGYANSGYLGKPNPIDRNNGDLFNASLDLRHTPGVFPATPDDSVVPTAQPLWWFTLRGEDPNLPDVSTFADIESAPALYVKATTPSVAVPPTASNIDYTPTVYIGSAHGQESDSNVGRLYALNGLYGPSGNNSSNDPRKLDPTVAAYGGPGSANYNIAQRPTLPTVGGVADTADWSFPDAYGTQPKAINSSQKARPALGNVTGSPVVFTNAHETNLALQTRIYFDANSGLEVPVGSANGTVAAARPDASQTGRIWAVNLDGSVGTTTNSGAAVNASGSNVWCFPLANNPNDSTKDTVAEPNRPIGAFLHATPAIGYVQFPKQSDNAFPGGSGPYTDVINPGGSGVFGQSVPMLYVGTSGVNDTGLYYIDIDGDATLGSPATTRRQIYRQSSPNGSIFQCSPALISNSSTLASGGNGGSVFITAGNSFYDFSATPLSNFNPAENFRLVRLNQQYTTMGPISSPIVAACDVSDLNGAPAYTNPVTGLPAIVTDWVYVGDSLYGVCRGFTPHDLTDSAIPTDLDAIVPTGFNPITPVDLTVSMQAYLVAEANKSSIDSASALAIDKNAPLPVYEWGQNVYIRFANVVPPAPIGGGPVVIVYDHTTTPTVANPVTAYGKGEQIEFDLSDATPNTDGSPIAPTDHAVIPATLIASPAPGQPLPDGFFNESPYNTGFNLANTAITPAQYIAAYTYTIADGSARLNTPGSSRQVLNAHQTVEVYTFDGTTATDTGRTTQITAFISNGNKVSTAATRNANGQITSYAATLTPVAGEDQPTFGILNPIAVRGGGVNLLNPGGPAVQVGDDLGPFRGVAPTITNDPFDLQALANGNDIPVVAPPSSAGGKGVINPEQPLEQSAAVFNPQKTPRLVVTSTGLISHNGSGDNSDPTGQTLLPTGSSAQSGEGLTAQNFGSIAIPFAANITDRGAISLLGQQIRVKAGTISSGIAALAWNDNSQNVTGHDSVVNFLPWELAPNGTGYKTGVANPSPDYPDISPSHISATVYQPNVGNLSFAGTPEDLTLGQGYLASAKIGSGVTAVQDRLVYVNPLQFHIDVPHWQPANQQLYQKINPTDPYVNGAEISPVNTTTGASNIVAGDIVFPMGYVTTRRIYVPRQGGVYVAGAACRYIRVYTGVPPDFGLQMGKPIVDIGQTVPSGFGVQTSASPLYVSGTNTDFNPYNTAFQSYFQELPIYNTGNVNLMNVRLNQRIAQQDNISGIFSLLMTSDSADPLSFIPAWDYLGVTGKNSLSGKNNFLIRSSLDSDISVVNPALVGGQYPGPTFHKSRVGDANPTQMTMPDVPHDNNPNSSGFYPTAFTPTDKPVANAGLPLYPSFAAPPYVSVAIPFGTPVGTYHMPRTLQAFEGYDNPLTYISSNLIAYLFPPRYGGILPGQGVKANSPVHDFLVAPILPASGPFLKGAPAQHPISSNGTDIKVSVVEDRLTDGFTNGALPMIDTGVAALAVGAVAAHATPDFGPAAFRDPFTGNLSLYWTTGRTGNGFGIEAANVTMNQTPAVPGGVPYFTPTNPAQNWWNYSAAFSTPSGTNSGLTIAQDPLDAASPSASANVFSFVVNVQAQQTPTVIPYSNTLFCYPVKTDSGVLGTGQAITNDPSQVKYGVKGLYFKSATNFTNNLWAFWTATTRGRTAIYYNSTVASGSGNWLATTGLLPIPAGLTAVSDPAPILLYSPAATGGGFVPAIAVTYSGTGPDGNVDLYESRYVAHGTSATDAPKLDLIPSLAVTETLVKVTGGGWYQSRDVAWSRNGALNIAMTNGTAAATPLLYNGPTPLFSRAVFDKASGDLVLTGIPNVTLTGAPSTLAFNAPATTTVTAYVDLATGRVRFNATPNGTLTATFSPLARRLTNDSRADTSPVTFLDGNYKSNDAGFNNIGLPGSVTPIPKIKADRRWYIWRKSGVGGGAPSATIYYKTQRLTIFLPSAIKLDINQQPIIKVTVGSTTVYDSTAVGSAVADVDALHGRVYVPINLGGSVPAEGQPCSVTYTENTTGNSRIISDVLQWQDELRSNDSSVPPTDSISGLATVNPGYQVPLNQPVNEDNVSAFLDPFAGLNSEHKVWLFWNSTRNGTADIYSETINPLFTAGP